jgi:hypothetical protein
MRKVCEASKADSFEKSAFLIEVLMGAKISAKRVQLITERVGQALLERREEDCQLFIEARARASDGVGAPALLIISADGGSVQTRQDDPSKKWKENKCGFVADSVPSPELPGDDPYRGPSPGARTVTATLKSWDSLGDYLSCVAEQRGYSKAAEKVFISDGAPGIRSMRERCFPDAAFILDWAHAATHLHHCALACFADAAKREKWYEAQKERLWNGRTDLVIKNLERRLKRLGPLPDDASAQDPRRVIANNIQYFRENAAGTRYPYFRSQGWPVGSGLVESAVKQLGIRVKGTEKHWSVCGVEQTLQVVAALISDDGAWDDFWKKGSIAA